MSEHCVQETLVDYGVCYQKCDDKYADKSTCCLECISWGPDRCSKKLNQIDGSEFTGRCGEMKKTGEERLCPPCSEFGRKA
jgi:hypothetical protein